MPAIAYERGTGRRATTPSLTPLESTTYKHSSRVAPRHGSSTQIHSAPSSISSNSSVAGISIMKPIKKAPKSASYRQSLDLFETPFEAHLEDIYAGRVSADDGLMFFESHGYYDVSDANTVAMFRQNFGMKKQFWDGHENELVFYEELNLDTVDLAGLQVLSMGALLSKDLKRQRTTSGRFQLLDEAGKEVDPEAQYEAEREKRMKLQHMEVDEDDLAALAEEQIVLAKAITIIHTEKTRFRKYFYEACNDELKQERAVVPAPSLSTPLPPYSGYLYMLKDTIPHLFRSWHKRWFYLDFNAGLVQMYKRSYWKSARGVLDMRSVKTIIRMNHSDLCIQCYDGRSILVRSKLGAQDAELWMNLLNCARRQVGNSNSPKELAQLPMSSSMTETTLTQIRTTTVAYKTPNNMLVSTKVRAQNERSVLETMAVLMQSKSTTNSITAA